MSIQTATTSTPTSTDLETFISLLSTCYLNVPLTTAFINEIDNSDTTPTPQRLKEHFSLGLPAAFRSNILLTIAASPSSPRPLAAALFEPPDFSGTPPSQARKKPGPVLSQYRAVARALKANHLSMPDSGPHSNETPAAPSQSSSNPSGDPYPNEFNKDVETEVRRFYHLAFLVRDTQSPPQEVEQAVQMVMRQYLARATQEDVPVFLEASSEASRDEFRDLGFRVVEEVTVGKGLVDGRGRPSQTGEGVKVWGMIYNE